MSVSKEEQKLKVFRSELKAACDSHLKVHFQQAAHFSKSHISTETIRVRKAFHVAVCSLPHQKGIAVFLH